MFAEQTITIEFATMSQTKPPSGRHIQLESIVIST